MTAASHAQANEDLLLFNALRQVSPEVGFYIDVGANDPEKGSVTKLFYDQGWHGVNIAPFPEWFARLAEARTRDVNIRAVASNLPGEVMFNVSPVSSLVPWWTNLRDATRKPASRYTNSLFVLISQYGGNHGAGSIAYALLPFD